MGADAADDKDAVGLPHSLYILDGKGEQTQERPPVGNMDLSRVRFGVGGSGVGNDWILHPGAETTHRGIYS